MKEWLWQIAVKKAVSRGVQLLVAWLTSMGLESWGIKIDVNQLTIAIFTLLEFVRNWLKVRFGWGWL